MAVPIAIAAQRSMDLFYTNYKTNSDFFELDDFISHCAGVLGAVYQDGYQKMRAEMRQEKKDEIISFDADILVEQLLDVVEKEGELYSILKNPVMAFPYDEQSVGIQNIFDGLGRQIRFERTTLSAAQFQLEYVPVGNIIWYYKVKDRLKFVNKTPYRLGSIKVWTVPSVTDPELMVPDGVYEYVITTAAMTIKEGGKGAVVKKSLDGNQNKLIQTEADLSSLK